ncbi:spore gernimation protein [Bacillus timonensis]|uniref:Spore gernimation protein n=1 Tax=Bacillus timonensis TaxID=1033734 RepID=A0A4S3PLR5_9BACI|nr:endospore germination permease [Bacillus timonensis]THE09602.1 spore gernimation protein [Bacillus timonensis]
MKSFEYGDGEIGKKEIMYAVPSMVIGIGILSLPRLLANATNFYDGAIALLIGGALAILFTWIAANLSSRFPKKSFFSFAPLLVPKPIVFILNVWFTIHFIFFVAYEIRAIGEIAEQYLFSRTPVEILSVMFLLVVVYSVSGSRVGILRLNLLFLPIICFIAVSISLMNITYFEFQNLLPVFTTDWSGYLEGVKLSFFSFAGFEIVLFYVAFMNRTKQAAKFAAAGMGLVVGLYLIIFTTCIGVFTNDTTSTMVYPTIELAKEVEVPGGFFERFESLFFTIWIMAIFNTTAMSLDIAVFSMGSLFRNMKKATRILIISPLSYLICMFPQNINEITSFGTFISYSGGLVTIFIPSILLAIAKLRGIGKCE